MNIQNVIINLFGGKEEEKERWKQILLYNLKYFQFNSKIIKMGASKSAVTGIAKRAVIAISRSTGLSITTTIILSGVIIVAIQMGGYYLYTRLNANDMIDQALVNVVLNNQQLNPHYQGPQRPDWQQISMTRQQFNSLYELSQDRYREKIKDLTCPYSMQVMRIPCKMRCCKNKSITDKWAEQCYLKNEIQNLGRCLICHQQVDSNFIQFDEDKYEQILGFRQRLIKAYKTSSSQQKQVWKNLIDKEFGNGYTEEHLENFHFT